MAMEESQIEAGKCYSVGGGLNYKVLFINRGIVSFKSWSKGGKLSILRENCGIKAFAEVVRKEVTCLPEE